MVEMDKVWTAVADIQTKVPFGAEVIQEHLDDIAHREARRLEGARTTEELLDARGRWILARELADTWRDSERRLRAITTP